MSLLQHRLERTPSLVAAVLFACVVACVTCLPSLLKADCQASDSRLQHLADTVNCSLVGSGCSAHHDWPSQVVYWQDLLNGLTDPSTCLNTTTANQVFSWLALEQTQQTISGSFANTWQVFQVQYYDMPRKPGVRIEAPDTLGRKCWAFTYLQRFWDDANVTHAATAAGVRSDKLVTMYQQAAPLTMELCRKVEENCFLNQTYNPAENGTCPDKIFEFHYLGFDRENLKRLNPLQYPFY